VTARSWTIFIEPVLASASSAPRLRISERRNPPARNFPGSIARSPRHGCNPLASMASSRHGTRSTRRSTGGQAGADPVQVSGCGCRVATRSPARAGLWLLALAALGLRRKLARVSRQ
jgi:MYXO-CTERM domain-containing protein